MGRTEADRTAGRASSPVLLAVLATTPLVSAGLAPLHPLALLAALAVALATLAATDRRVSPSLDRRSLLTELLRERRVLAGVLASSSDGVISVGPDGRVRSWNPAMAAITGVGAAEALGEPAHGVFRPVCRDGEPRSGRAVPAWSGGVTGGELVSITTGRGETVWLRCSWWPLPEGGHVVVARDETERARLQEDKDDWLAQVGHELRTPLTPLKGFLHILARSGEGLDPERRRGIYEAMLLEQERLEDLVEELLRATELDQELDTPVREVVGWREIVREQVERCARREGAREIDLRVAPGLPRVVTDTRLATGALAHLLSNACKYGTEDGRIEVTVDLREDGIVTTVADDGPGVPSGDRERVFEKFTRLGDHLTRARPGIGLGLYVASRSVRCLDGEIWIDDAECGGAAVSFSLPAHTVERTGPAADATAAATRPGRPTRTAG